MDSNKDNDTVGETPKKCFCAQCFTAIDPDDRIDVDGQNFHKSCCMCCICRQVPTSIRMYCGHLFCQECFKNQVMTRFRGEGPRMQSNSWWMQYAPQPCIPPSQSEKVELDESSKKCEKEPTKKCICARCLQTVEDDAKITIGDQHFHSQCARCYCCRTVPTGNVKIYYGQVFCEACFHRYVMPRNKDNPSDFFKYCFDQWQSNAQFAENMKDFMNTSNGTEPPVIFLPSQGGCSPSFCKCGNAPQDWFSKPEQAKKCA